MKHHSPPISHEAKTTIADVVRWAHELARLHTRIAPHLAQCYVSFLTIVRKRNVNADRKRIGL